MKINHKIYDSITTEPFEVQTLADGVTVEFHSLNQNEYLFNQYAPQAKFAIWSSKEGTNYRLLLEDTYYPRMRELYGKRVNQCMIDFWNKVEKQRSKIMKRVFIPVSIIVFLGFIASIILLGGFPDAQMIAMAVLLLAFIVVNVFVNRKIDSAVNKFNSEAVEKIKNIVGHKHFDELVDIQQAHYDEFFGITHEEETTPEE